LSLGSFLEFKLEKCVGDNSNPDVNRLDIILNLGNGFLNLLEWTVVTKGFTCVINLLFDLGKSFVDLTEFILHVSDVLAHSSETVLDISQVV